MSDLGSCWRSAMSRLEDRAYLRDLDSLWVLWDCKRVGDTGQWLNNRGRAQQVTGLGMKVGGCLGEK